ncbi:MAG: MerR family transcriptional regulator [Acidimicrobiales bacterium]
MGERHYLSIGEVLSLLREEFPDVTISKIRFLESQGLLDPERTPSGYRKFYDDDVERLRWILRQQREHFLPLKVIKGRLGGQAGASNSDRDDPDVSDPTTAAASGPASRAGAAAPHTARHRREERPSEGPEAGDPAPNGARSRERAANSARLARSALEDGGPDPLAPAQSGASLTLAELGAASGLSVEDLRDLERFGLLGGRPVGGTVYYEEEALAVACLAAGFMKFGVEARHLRMYRNSAERESSFFEQVVMPMIKQRNPQARRQAVETLSELARLGQQMRAAMLRQALSEYLAGA